ncbi:hypothetical protein GLOIN_2v1604110 [Rhizophagus irregularis DAOM 181602=DAOM 197198]|uniref:Uncharacterized protein n=1 Tax=Rhizophagus irregularis (strain DAOM 181602 / DAOM 197198 / MUCL 43194) TaxID=747089 RepID=A0A2P4Q1Y3_RHIID|nr:hypothetical protein GLOIN_2v1604110 [Rhizophagus irregularis DAOM 181602=DAOM 197198]POG71592.1 hypothetical protein GLOIN_2v1604110 [Rhizophagus irregularis DAOM 181602=DAOM 197198]GBC42102.2 hypothetical protein GLOIN_2v1604110 [Rhizophagus irregularis DAOM 181602=DAOM 197198]|eukprot:XP_025178458.1 hypothetical protein GLOIN_2v1604110 [Rhizophagus irregularis DAOM 181602=DAOM 197198]
MYYYTYFFNSIFNPKTFSSYKKLFFFMSMAQALSLPNSKFEVFNPFIFSFLTIKHSLVHIIIHGFYF